MFIAYTDSNGSGYGNSNTNGYSNRDGDGHGYGNATAYKHTKADPNAEACTDAASAADTGAETLIPRLATP